MRHGFVWLPECFLQKFYADRTGQALANSIGNDSNLYSSLISAEKIESILRLRRFFRALFSRAIFILRMENDD